MRNVYRLRQVEEESAGGVDPELTHLTVPALIREASGVSGRTSECVCACKCVISVRVNLKTFD